MNKADWGREQAKKNKEMGVYERQRTRWLEHNPMYDEKLKKKATRQRKKVGTYEKIVKINRANGVYDRFSEFTIKRNIEDNPMNHPESRQKAKETFLRKYGVDNPFKSDEIKKKADETRKKNHSYEKSAKTRNEKLPFWFLGIPFASKGEMLCAKLLFEKLNFVPIGNINTHIYFSYKSIDFYFLGMFFEFHPENNYRHFSPRKDYYKKRREVLDKNNHKKSILIHVIDIKEADRIITFLVNSLKGYLDPDLKEFL